MPASMNGCPCSTHLHPSPPPPVPAPLPLLPQVRDGVLYMLDGWITVSSSATLFPAVAEAVGNPKCIADGKIAGLQW